LFLLESEYLRAVTAAEPKWVLGVAADLQNERLNWKPEELADLAKQFTPSE
jgi:hypothetical protein